MIKSKNIITILDIGSTKISCFIIKKIYADNYEVLGVSQTASFGVKSGMVVDLESARNSIVKAVEIAEKMASITVKNVYVSLNSSYLISERSSADVLFKYFFNLEYGFSVDCFWVKSSSLAAAVDYVGCCFSYFTLE